MTCQREWAEFPYKGLFACCSSGNKGELPCTVFRMKAGDSNQFGNLPPRTAPLDVSDVLNGIADLTLNGGKGQTGIGLECKPRELIQRMIGRAGMHCGNRARVTGIESLQQIVG